MHDILYLLRTSSHHGFRRVRRGYQAPIVVTAYVLFRLISRVRTTRPVQIRLLFLRAAYIPIWSFLGNRRAIDILLAQIILMTAYQVQVTQTWTQIVLLISIATSVLLAHHCIRPQSLVVLKDS